ncbi:type II secretion system F family protein [Chitinimonas koreensis]|uniref:type II secretion system F family protein n=1 Tax=Chitinimonas koreensis TaxID=356302 RepID=UPI00040546EE|nr:type II secretion system F family protein [Chitinimonas koreensis]QNM97789.1 type II secretion system F family protein [Chitinimonas koreensis]
MIWLALSLGGVAFAFWLAFAGVRQAFLDVPGEDRTYLDRPPTFYRLTWPLIQLVTFHTASLLSVRYRQRKQVELKAAGLDFTLGAEQFFSGKIVAALIAMLAVAIAYSPLGMAPPFVLAFIGGLGFMLPDLWLKDEKQRRHQQILKALPFYLDIVTLGIESGLNLTGALGKAAEKLPENPLKYELGRTLRDIRAGRSRAEALRSLADRLQIPAISSLVSAMVAADKQGASLGPILRAQAEQRRSERFLRAEKMAMEAPVKMLFPLIAFIFPCTFVVLAFPIVMKFLQEGLL